MSTCFYVPLTQTAAFKEKDFFEGFKNINFFARNPLNFD